MPTFDTPDLASGFTADAVTGQAYQRDQIQRIVHSEAFRSAQMLQQLLLYLADKGSSGEVGALKEYSIGTEALGRRADFDPKVDPIVRVQMHRLRQKLKEYYAAEGASDKLLLEIPRGQYLPVFHPREAALEQADPASDTAAAVGSEVQAVEDASRFAEPLAHVPGASGETRPAPHGWTLQVGTIGAVFVAFLAGLVAALCWVHLSGHLGQSGSIAQRNADPVEQFWAQFLQGDTAPIIGYPDAVFLLDDSNDLFRFRQGASDQRGALVNSDVTLKFAANPTVASRAGSLYYENGYTGTGELEGVAMLTGLFAKMGVKPTIKSSQDITTADLKQHNVILLGSPFQNTAEAQLPATGDLMFENPDAHRELWRAHILNLHPGPDEAARYQTVRNPSTGVLVADFGLVSIRQGVAPGLHIAVLGGLDTTGTQGATAFAVSAEGVGMMNDAMAALANSTSPGFQVLLKIDLEKGYQVLDTQMLGLHRIVNREHESSSLAENSTAPSAATAIPAKQGTKQP